MERRELDDEELRKIKVRRTAEGAIEDVIDELAKSEEFAQPEEVLIEVPEELEEDESFVDLTPAQLKAEMERREREAREAEKQRDELIAAGEEALAAEDFAAAGPFFSQAIVLDGSSLRAHCGLWTARTENFSRYDAFYDEDCALEAAQAPEEVREFLLARAGDRLKEDRAALEEQTAPLRERVLSERANRRAAFRANRNYYLVRLLAFTATLLVALIGAAVSGAYIVRTTSPLPIVLVGVFALIALAALAVALVFLRKVIVAQRLCRENEIPASTEEGARLAEAELRLRCLADVLEGAQEE